MADAPRGPFIRRKPIRQIEEIFMQRGPDGELLFRPSEKITIDLPDQYVIAERKPIEAVSLSRNSPTIMISGSCRNAALNTLEKVKPV